MLRSVRWRLFNRAKSSGEFLYFRFHRQYDMCVWGGIRRIEGRLGMKIRESLDIASLLPATHMLGEVAKVSYNIGI